MGTRRRITLFSKSGKSLDDAGVKGMGLLAGKGMYASRSPREGFRPLMEESPLTTLLGDHPAPEPADAAPSRRVVIVIELACFIMIAFVAGSALLFYGSNSGTPVTPAASVARSGGDTEARGTAVLLQQLEPAAAPDAETEKAEPPAGPGPPAASATTIDLPPAVPQVALAPEPRRDAPADDAATQNRPGPATMPAPPLASVSPEEIAMLVERGDQLLRTGDIAGARLFFERAATAGSGEAAAGAGKTYDPLYLVSAGVRGIQGDPKRAAMWYRQAAAAGNAEAGQRLRALQFAFPQ